MTNEEMPLGYWCSMIGHRYYAQVQERLQGLGMERGFYALVLIAEADGHISQQELADALRMDKVTMVRTIDHLSERGLVERALWPGDRRKYRLKLLPKAKAAVREIRKTYITLNKAAFVGIPAKDMERFLSVLPGVIANLRLLDTPEKTTAKTHH